MVLLVLFGFSGTGIGQGPSFWDGIGTPKVMQLADQGNVVAQANLASRYANGMNTPQDYIQAYKWITLAIIGAVEDTGPAQRSQAAVDLRESIAGRMTAEQKAEGERLAQEWETAYIQSMGNGPYKRGWGVVTPKEIFHPLPSYTEKARQARASGCVVVECVVHKDGTVGECKILRGLGYGLDESAIHTITTKWRFKPGIYKGKPVDVLVLAEVVFKIR